jgi:hypothetical protein
MAVFITHELDVWMVFEQAPDLFRREAWVLLKDLLDQPRDAVSAPRPRVACSTGLGVTAVLDSAL